MLGRSAAVAACLLGSSGTSGARIAVGRSSAAVVVRRASAATQAASSAVGAREQ